MIEPYIGYFGKLPAHGDFVGNGLERQSQAVLDDWIGGQLSRAQQHHGEQFEAVWHAAPSWHFTWRAGVVDPQSAVSGVWFPSIDKVGRCFPFIVLLLHDPAQSGEHILSTLDELVRRAITDALSADELEYELLGKVKPPEASGVRVSDVWWRPGTKGAMLHGALLRDRAFDWLLDVVSEEGT